MIMIVLQVNEVECHDVWSKTILTYLYSYVKKAAC